MEFEGSWNLDSGTTGKEFDAFLALVVSMYD
jgi:hypothetical protein